MGCRTAGMSGYDVRVEDKVFAEFSRNCPALPEKLAEFFMGFLMHEAEHIVFCMLGSDLNCSGKMSEDELLQQAWSLQKKLHPKT